MKNLVTTALFIFITSLYSFAQQSEALPVLKVSFPATNIPDDDYISGEMVLEENNGTSTTLPAKFSLRGATARNYRMKPSFNMKLENELGDEIDTDLLGIRKASSWILDAMAIDRICMRNRVCFDLWNEFSRLPYETDFDSRNGTEGRFVIVYINDAYKGIYCLSDKVNRKLLNLKKPKIDNDEVEIRGVLYKQGTTDIGNQETVGFYNDSTVYVAAWHDAWELKEPDAYPSLAAWQPLVDYYDNHTPNYVLNNFYQDNLVDYSLFVMALAIQDNWGLKNKYFSIQNCTGDDNQRRFIVTPWDLDTSLGGHYNGDYYNGNYSQWTMNQVSGSALLPFSVCFSNAAVKDAMKTRWKELRTTALSVENVAAHLNDYCNLFVNSGAWQQYVDYWNAQNSRPKYVEDLRTEIDLIIEWYAERFNQMDEYFSINASGIETINTATAADSRAYNLQGMPVDINKLRHGEIYIMNGRKYIKSTL